MSQEYLEFEVENVQKAYDMGNDNVKQFFKTLFPKHNFDKKPKSVFDCTGIEDIFAFSGKETYAQFLEQNKQLSAYKLAELTLEIATEVINEGWWPTFKKGEHRYYPYFDIRSGFVLLGDCYYYDYYTTVGPALLFETSDKAKFAGRILTPIYKQYLMSTKK